MAGLGFAPEEVTPEAARAQGRMELRLKACPFKDAVLAEGGHLICALHRGVVRGALARIDDTAGLVAFEPKDPAAAGCRVEVEGLRTRFGIEAERLGNTIRVRLTGELDLVTGEMGRAAFETAIASAPATLVVDLHHLDIMDSSGLACVLHAHALAVDAGVRFAVLNGAGEPHRLLTLTGMDEVFEMVDDLSGIETPLEGASRTPGREAPTA